MTKVRFQWIVPLAALAALGAMEGWKHTLPDAESGKPFLAMIKEKFENYPVIRGDWQGTEGELPKEAVAMLHPNFYIDRSYLNSVTGERVGMYLIEAEDSRDMLGHYPPNCYPGSGWELVETVPSRNSIDDKPEWVVGNLRIKGTEYAFKRNITGQDERLWVRNFFLLPNGTSYADISSFGRAAADFYVRPFGATQVQIVFGREFYPDDRDRIFDSLIKAHMDLIEAVRKRK